MLDKRQMDKAEDITLDLNSVTPSPAQWRWEECAMRSVGFFLRYDGQTYGIRFSVEHMMDPDVDMLENIAYAIWKRIRQETESIPWVRELLPSGYFLGGLHGESD